MQMRHVQIGAADTWMRTCEVDSSSQEELTHATVFVAAGIVVLLLDRRLPAIASTTACDGDRSHCHTSTYVDASTRSYAVSDRNGNYSCNRRNPQRNP